MTETSQPAPRSQPQPQAQTQAQPQPQAQAQAKQPESKPNVSFEEFARLDLRVARVVTAKDHPNADRLFVLTLDDGSGQARQICAGIRGHYTADQLTGRLIVIVANLEPRKIRGEESRGMLLAASDAPKDAAGERHVIVLSPSSEIAPGSIVS